jgi:hypothetical protein
VANPQTAILLQPVARILDSITRTFGCELMKNDAERKEALRESRSPVARNGRASAAYQRYDCFRLSAWAVAMESCTVVSASELF